MIVFLGILCIITYFCKLFTLSIFNFQLRPIILGPIIGLLLGDFSVGMYFGAYLELVFLAFFGVGGAPPPEAEMAGIIGIACGIYGEQSLGGVLVAGLIAGYCGLLVFLKAVKPFSSKMAYIEIQAVGSGQVRRFEKLHRIVILTVPLFYLPLVVLLASFCMYALFPVLNSLPVFFIKALTIFAYLFPVMSVSQLIKTEWKWQSLPFLLLGFCLAAYFKGNALTVLLLVGVLAVLLMYPKTNSATQEAAQSLQTSSDSEEDDFF